MTMRTDQHLFSQNLQAVNLLTNVRGEMPSEESLPIAMINRIDISQRNERSNSTADCWSKQTILYKQFKLITISNPVLCEN